MRLPFAAALALLVLAAGCSQRPPQPSPSPSPAAGASASPAPGASASPAAGAASASPYRYVVTPPPPDPGKPAILEIDLLDQTIHEGAPYSVRVKTSPDVTAITVTAMGRSYGMQAAGPGLFASDGQVPDGIPFFFLNRSYPLTITAQTADGRSTSATLSLRLER